MHPFWKTHWPIKIKMQLTYDPRILMLVIYPREVKTYGHTKTCKQMFTAALFI